MSDRPAREDPIERFRKVYEEAVATGMDEPNAMVVSSVDAEGRPSSRLVLLKDFDDAGFVWIQQNCTNGDPVGLTGPIGQTLARQPRRGCRRRARVDRRRP